MDDCKADLMPELEMSVLKGHLTLKEAWLMQDELLVSPKGQWPVELRPLVLKAQLGAMRPQGRA